MYNQLYLAKRGTNRVALSYITPIKRKESKTFQCASINFSNLFVEITHRIHSAFQTRIPIRQTVPTLAAIRYYRADEFQREISPRKT